MSAPHPGIWAVLLVAVPLALALATYLTGRRIQPILVWIAPLTMTTIVTGLCYGLIHHGPVLYRIGGWAPPLGISWKVDGLAALMLVITSLVLGAVCIYSSGYFSGWIEPAKAARAGLFWPLAYLLWSALNALFLSADLFNIYVTLELLTLGSVGLIVLAGTADSLAAALRYLMLGLMASLFYLMGVALIYAAYGTLDVTTLGEQLRGDLLTWTAAGLMIVGLLIKTALFPMHFWLPPAHAGAPAPVSALLSALVVKASFYLVFRLWFDVFPAVAQPPAAQFLGVLGACAIVWGAIQALRADRLKTLVAYSTVAQLGYLFLVFPLASGPAVAMSAWLGAVFFALSHALAKAAMFLAAGRIQQLNGDDRLDRLAGIGERAPLAVSATALAGVSLMGLPPSGGFAGKWMLLVAGVHSGQWWWAVVVVAGGLLTAGYLFRFWAIAIAAPKQPTEKARINWRMELPPLALGAAAVLCVLVTTYAADLVAMGAAFPIAGSVEPVP